MIKKRLLLTSYCLLVLTILRGQCPDNNLLQKRLLALRDSAGFIAPMQRLKELQDYQAQIKACKYLPDTTHALLLQNIGAAFYDLDDFVRAIQSTKQSVGLLSKIHTVSTGGELLAAYYNLFMMYQALNDFQARNTAVDSCIAVGKRLPVVQEEYVRALLKKVDFLFQAGDYSFCYSYAVMGEEVCNNYKNVGASSYKMYFFFRKVNTLINDRKYDQAEKLLLSIPKNSFGTGEMDYLATIYGQLAEIKINQGKPAELANYIRKGLACLQQTGNNVRSMEMLNNLGYYFYFNHLKNYPKALQTYEAALQYGHKKTARLPEKWESLNILSNIAALYVQQHQYDTALRYFQLAFDQLAPGINETGILDSLSIQFLKNGNAKYLTGLVIDKADAFLARYQYKKNTADLDEAIRIYKLADRMVERIKTAHIDQASKLTWRMNSGRLYEHAIAACYQDNRTADAFYFFEKSRAVLLSDQLTEQNLVSQDDLLAEAQLNRNIASNESLLKSKDPSGASYARLSESILDTKQKLFQLQQLVKIRNPVYYQHFIDTSFITLEGMRQKLLVPGKALVEIYAGDSAVYILIIQSTKATIRRIDKITYDSTAKKFINYLSDANLLNKNFADFTVTANILYSLVFDKIALPEDRIIISPDGRYFPFEALVVGRTGSHTEYFLSRHAVSYTYSSRFLLNDFNTPTKSGARDFLGVAPVEYRSDQNLASLNGCDLSLERLGQHFNEPTLQVFKNATRYNFMKDFTSYSVIQLYTHASDTSASGEPVIYFSDSALYLSDLVGGAKPATNLIVLSACNTGTGQVHAGEGVFSFNRGFAALGIPASVTSLWSVDKESVIRLTELFYKYLEKGLPTDVALQQAKLEFLRSSSKMSELPYYWAGTILAGKPDTLSFKKKSYWKIALVSLVCFSLLLIIYNKWKRRSRGIATHHLL